MLPALMPYGSGFGGAVPDVAYSHQAPGGRAPAIEGSVSACARMSCILQKAFMVI